MPPKIAILWDIAPVASEWEEQIEGLGCDAGPKWQPHHHKLAGNELSLLNQIKHVFFITHLHEYTQYR